MDSFQKKSIETSRGFSFTYYVSNPANANNNVPTLLLLHGFPDDAHLWQCVVAKLPRYRIIAPDLLGYSGTSKPTDPAAYNHAAQTQDLTEILDAEGVDQVISIGHDWGSQVAQRLYLHHPSRVAGLVMLNVPYILPSKEPFDLEAGLAISEKIFGYAALAYWEFFLADDAAAIMKEKVERLYEGMHGAPKDWMQQLFCTKGALRKWLTLNDDDPGSKVELRNYAKNPELRRAFMERFQRDGFEAPLCYYRAVNQNVHSEAENDIPQERLVVHVPTLYAACTLDPLCRPEIMHAPAKMAGCLPDLEEVTIECAHWCPLEKPHEVARAIESFLKKKFTA